MSRNDAVSFLASWVSLTAGKNKRMWLEAWECVVYSLTSSGEWSVLFGIFFCICYANFHVVVITLQESFACF